VQSAGSSCSVNQVVERKSYIFSWWMGLSSAMVAPILPVLSYWNFLASCHPEAGLVPAQSRSADCPV